MNLNAHFVPPYKLNITGSLGSPRKTRIQELYTKITTDPDCSQEADPLRRVDSQFAPK